MWYATNPKNFAGTRTESPSFEYAAIFLMFTTFFADEGIAHRLGLIPLKTDLSEFGKISEFKH